MLNAHKTKQIEVTISEVIIIVRHETYQVEVNENDVNRFISDISVLDNYSDTHEILSKFNAKFIDDFYGKQYSYDYDDGFSIDEVKIIDTSK